MSSRRLVGQAVVPAAQPPAPRPRVLELEVGALDIAAGPPGTVMTHPLLTAEAKVTDGGSKGLTAMMAVFAELNGTGPQAEVPRDTWTNAERKYRSLQLLRPAVFVEVAPERRAHDLEHGGDGKRSSSPFLRCRCRVRWAGMEVSTPFSEPAPL